MVAALLLVLLPFGVLAGEARAQDDTTGEESRQTLRTITNTASAQWNFAGSAVSTTSNEVAFDVTLPPPEIRSFRPSAGGGSELTFRSPVCNAPGRSGLAVSTAPDMATMQSQSAQSTMVDETNVLRAGQTLIFEVQALEANIDPQEIDQLEIVITTSTGDRETETIFETGPNTGVFVGQIDTVRIPPGAQPDDCRLGLTDGAMIVITASLPGSDDIIITTDVEVLADPFGVVFDSETGEPVDGARVTLVDAATGQPATVFAEDGVTPWPSSVISGEPITDGAGRVTDMGAGEFWFPLTFLGTYRLVVEPPEPYTAPSVVQPAEIAQITRPDGRSFVILDASYGGNFTLVDQTPVQVDIPLDRPSLDLGLNKTASRAQAVPGDVVFYALTATNSDPSRAKRNVTVTDTPSRWLRLRPDTVRVNGAEAPDAITIAPDGSTLQIDLGTLAGGASARVTYAMTVRPDAPPGRALNDAVVTDVLGRTARAQVAVDIERENIADRMTI
ncbi:MAG: hypothetical protein SXU28_14135, partial [Pseudomonadota bacterium]|nr:hypothetical protein [Pseudomonadota bacterium]